MQDVYNSKKKPEKDSRKEKDSGNEDEKSKTAGGEIEEVSFGKLLVKTNGQGHD